VLTADNEADGEVVALQPWAVEWFFRLAYPGAGVTGDYLAPWEETQTCQASGYAVHLTSAGLLPRWGGAIVPERDVVVAQYSGGHVSVESGTVLLARGRCSLVSHPALLGGGTGMRPTPASPVMVQLVHS
jgi:hypothetical protein